MSASTITIAARQLTRRCSISSISSSCSSGVRVRNFFSGIKSNVSYSFLGSNNFSRSSNDSNSNSFSSSSISINSCNRMTQSRGYRGESSSSSHDDDEDYHNTYVPEEGNYMVTADPILDPKEFKISLLPEKIKVEIYQKHKSDPENWNIQALAKAYKANVDRIKAVILLQRRREEYFISTGLQDNLQEWLSISKRHAEVTANPPLQEDGKTPVETPPLALVSEEFKKSEEEVTTILKKIKRHMMNQEDMEQTEKDLSDMLEEFGEMGYDTSFKETDSQEKSSWIDNYYPEFFGDDNFEEMKKALLDRIKRETKARSSKDEKEFEDMNNIVLTAESFSPDQLTLDNAKEGNGKFGRFKYAFRDLSEPINNRNTYVSTRSGKVRKATSLETMMRSWSRKPKTLDLELYKSKLAKYNDPDGDDSAFLELQLQRNVRDKAIKAKAGAGKKK